MSLLKQALQEMKPTVKSQEDKPKSVANLAIVFDTVENAIEFQQEASVELYSARFGQSKAPEVYQNKRIMDGKVLWIQHEGRTEFVNSIYRNFEEIIQKVEDLFFSAETLPQDWLVNTMECQALGVKHYFTLGSEQTLDEVIEAIASKLNAIEKKEASEDELHNGLSTYSFQEWASDNRQFIAANWDITDEQLDELFSNLQDKFEQRLKGVAYLGYPTSNYELYNRFQDRYRNLPNMDSSFKTKAILSSLAGMKASDKLKEALVSFENKTVGKYDGLWHQLRKDAMNSLSFLCAPKDYEEASKLYDDESDYTHLYTKTQQVERLFKSALPRPEGDIVQSPEKALSLTRILCQDIDYRERPLKTLLSFLVADYLWCTEMLFDKIMRELIIERAETIEKQEVSEDWWFALHKEAVQHRDLQWYN